MFLLLSDNLEIFSDLLSIAVKDNLRKLSVKINAFALAATHARSLSQGLLSIPASNRIFVTTMFSSNTITNCNRTVTAGPNDLLHNTPYYLSACNEIPTGILSISLPKKHQRGKLFFFFLHTLLSTATCMQIC